MAATAATPRRQLLVLDIDGTLISDDDKGAERPGAREFLAKCLASKEFDTAVWSAASPLHVHSVLARLIPAKDDRAKLAFVLCDERCVRVIPQPRDDDAENECGGLMVIPRTIKPLKKIWSCARFRRLGYTRATTLVVDDTPSTYSRNYGNAVHISRYTSPDASDRALEHVWDTITARFAQADVRIKSH